MSGKFECMVCFETGAECTLLGLLCWQHDIYTNCFKRAVKLAIADENHYPLSCGSNGCQRIDDQEVERHLSMGNDDDHSLLAQYQAKAEEYGIASDARIYCASQECQSAHGRSRFINPELMGDDTKVICPDCSSITCRLCRDLVDGDNQHVCKEDDLDVEVRAYIKTLPEEEFWLRQKCYACRSWVEKTSACNHMTCRCKAQFCLICARKWPDGGSSCRHGCPHYARPEYDEQGYNQFGYHRETGLDRAGNPHDPSIDLAGDNDNYEDDDYENDYPVYNEQGFDQNGFDRDGFNARGFDDQGFDRQGLDVDGFDWVGFDSDGFDRDGYNS